MIIIPQKKTNDCAILHQTPNWKNGKWFPMRRMTSNQNAKKLKKGFFVNIKKLLSFDNNIYLLWAKEKEIYTGQATIYNKKYKHLTISPSPSLILLPQMKVGKIIFISPAYPHCFCASTLWIKQKNVTGEGGEVIKASVLIFQLFSWAERAGEEKGNDDDEVVRPPPATRRS